MPRIVTHGFIKKAGVLTPDWLPSNSRDKSRLEMGSVSPTLSWKHRDTHFLITTPHQTTSVTNQCPIRLSAEVCLHNLLPENHEIFPQ